MNMFKLYLHVYLNSVICSSRSSVHRAKPTRPGKSWECLFGIISISVYQLCSYSLILTRRRPNGKATLKANCFHLLKHIGAVALSQEDRSTITVQSICHQQGEPYSLDSIEKRHRQQPVQLPFPIHPGGIRGAGSEIFDRTGAALDLCPASSAIDLLRVAVQCIRIRPVKTTTAV